MLNSKKDILILTLGGTIESHYNPEEGTPAIVPTKLGSTLPDAIKKLGLDARCDIYPICMKDSKNISASDLLRSVKIALDHPNHKKIMVVQGTDTMPVNARRFEKLLKANGVNDKTVIFTGAMEPLRDKRGEWRAEADGWKNLEKAFSAADEKPAGAYVVIDETCHKASDITKYVETDENGMVLDSGFVERRIRSSEHIAPSR